MKRFILLSMISLLIFLPLFTFAQFGIIRGTIVDTSPNRNPVGGVTISYVGSGVDNRGDVTTDATTGEYEITGLRPGQYVLSAHKAGFVDISEIPATIVAGNDTVVEIKMRKKDTVISYFQKMGAMGSLVLGLLFIIFVLLALVIYLLKTRSENPQGIG